MYYWRKKGRCENGKSKRRGCDGKSKDVGIRYIYTRPQCLFPMGLWWIRSHFPWTECICEIWNARVYLLQVSPGNEVFIDYPEMDDEQL